MDTGTLHLIMAEDEGVAEIVPPGTEGAIECRAPGCTNWFVKRSGRHMYCRGPGCTYKRGAATAQELEEPEGAVVELLRRLQDQQESEVGPGQLGERIRAVQTAMRANDTQALYGALIDVGTTVVWYADRVRRGEMVRATTEVVPGAPKARRLESNRPVGLVQAVISSHQRTWMLAERRQEATWEVLAAKEQLESARHGMAQMQGTMDEPPTREQVMLAEERFARAERALQSLEAAWAERAQTLAELEGAAATVAAISPRNGGAAVA